MKRFVLIFFMLAQTATASVKVVDGDSLEIDNQRIRLDGIDAPEFLQTCENEYNQSYNYGQDAKAYLQNLITDAKIECNCLPKKDKYNRKVCECFSNKISLNRKMVAVGLARAYRSKLYIKDEQLASKKHRGIWRGKHMRPALYRILHRAERRK